MRFKVGDEVVRNPQFHDWYWQNLVGERCMADVYRVEAVNTQGDIKVGGKSAFCIAHKFSPHYTPIDLDTYL